jgi:hypothetical protein
VAELVGKARGFLEFRRRHQLPVKTSAEIAVAMVTTAVEEPQTKSQITIEQRDLTIVHELADAFDRMRCSWFVKWCQTHAVACWLGTLLPAVMSAAWGSFDFLLIWPTMPLVGAFLVYVILPFRLLMFAGVWALSHLNDRLRPTLFEPHADDVIMAAAMPAAVMVMTYGLPSWFIARQFRTGQECRWAWWMVAMLRLCELAALKWFTGRN